MDEPKVSKYSTSFGLSLAITSVASALLVVAKELCPPVMTAMKKLTGHHWITHSTLAVTLFLVLGIALAQVNRGAGVRTTASQLIFFVAGGAVIGALIIAGFYLFVG